MQNITPDLKDIRIFQKLGRVDAASLEAVDQLLLILPEKPRKTVFDRLPQGAKMQALIRKHAPDSTPAFTTRQANKRQTLIVAGTLKPGATAFEQLTLGRKLVAAATAQKAGSLGICAIGFAADAQATIVGNVLAAALAAAVSMPAYKRNPDPGKIRSIRVLGLDERLDTARIQAEAKGKNLARWLTALPPNLLDANAYGDLARDMAKERGWEH